MGNDVFMAVEMLQQQDTTADSGNDCWARNSGLMLSMFPVQNPPLLCFYPRFFFFFADERDGGAAAGEVRKENPLDRGETVAGMHVYAYVSWCRAQSSPPPA